MESNTKNIDISSLGNGLARAAIQSLLESRGLKIEDFDPCAAASKKISEAIARLEKEKQLQEYSSFCSNLRNLINDKKFSDLKQLAYIETEKFIKLNEHELNNLDSCSEETVFNCLLNIQIPENLFGFSKEFFLSLIITLILFHISGKKAKKDKEEILKAIASKNKNDDL